MKTLKYEKMRCLKTIYYIPFHTSWKRKKKNRKRKLQRLFSPPPKKKDVNSTLIEVKALKNPSNSFLIEYLSIDELSNLI